MDSDPKLYDVVFALTFSRTHNKIAIVATNLRASKVHEAKTKTFDDKPLRFGRLAHTTGFLVRRLHGLLTGSWPEDTKAASGRTTPVQAGLLILINENPGVTQTRLMKALEVESATMVRSISKMLDAGLITKTRSEMDKRAFYLDLTDEGRSILADIEDAMETRDRKLAEDIDPNDLRAFHLVVRHMIAKRSVGTQSGILAGLLLSDLPKTEAAAGTGRAITTPPQQSERRDAL
ncbi:MAG: DNA-binding MarR family transcriptional regulator [Akkermansiaceae bacterium]|jgi:DNA-binding MarR family transcriptional regulator